MLPDFLAGSYRRYKQDTTLFTTWLAKAASSVGYRTNWTLNRQAQDPELKPELGANQSTQTAVPPKGGRLKGKARKAAKDAAAGSSKRPGAEPSGPPSSPTIKYTITTGELLRQAEAVASSHLEHHVRMPATLRAVVERAIRARKRCSEWFRQSGVSNQYADQQHIYFIGILEQSMQILEPCIEPSGQDPEQGSLSPEHDETTNSTAKHLSSRNLQESLDVDPADTFDSGSDSGKSASAPGADGNNVYELDFEDGFDEELAFIIFCFFEDLHCTQDYIKELWRKYKARKCDLHTAAITTNAAFDVVRQAEEDLVAQVPTVFHEKRSYDSIATKIFYADAFQQGAHHEAHLQNNGSPRTTPFDDFVYLSTARILMKFTYVADVPNHSTLPYPLPCPPLRLHYVSRPEMLGTPEMNKKEQEDLALSMFIIDRQLWNRYKQRAVEETCEPPLDDEFSKSIDKLLEKGCLSVALVFEARVFLDIQDIMGDEICRGHQDLVRNTNRIHKIINLKVDGDGAWQVGGSGECWDIQDRDVVVRMMLTSMYWILDGPVNDFPRFKEFQRTLPPTGTLSVRRSDLDIVPGSGPPCQHMFVQMMGRSSTVDPPIDQIMPSDDPKLNDIPAVNQRQVQSVDTVDPKYLGAMSKRLMERYASPEQEYVELTALNLDMISASNNANYLFTTNPIYCGLVSFNFLTDFETAGISLTNRHRSIWPMAHLYNALQQSSGMPRAWPEMDHLIDLQMDALFANDIPLSAHAMYVRFSLTLGLPINSISRNTSHRPNNAYQRFQQEVDGIRLSSTKISSVFRDYFEKKMTLGVCLLKLDRLMRDPGPKATKKAREKSKRPLTNLQFLAVLEANLPKISRRLRFDYITLTKQCKKLLEDTRERILIQELGNSYPLMTSKDRAEQTLTRIVLRMLKQHSDLLGLP
ncbi:MAG: hypothetical protein Q9168_005518 [Polycauliona sp. 1 TL-2023]